MEKEFVTYGQALALKELGFDEDCFGEWQNLEIGKNLSIYQEDNHIYDVPVLAAEIRAPLKQQVFRWFREKYSLLPNIWSGKINHIFYGYDILHIKKQKFVINNTDLGGGDCDYDTYEEAENAAIDKLIELAKPQDK